VAADTYETSEEEGLAKKAGLMELRAREIEARARRIEAEIRLLKANAELEAMRKGMRGEDAGSR
jgi:hypothetical protein